MADQRIPAGRRARSAVLGEPSEVLDVTFEAVFRLLLAFSIYLHFAGHNQPGGGFIAGLVAGAALVLSSITGHSLVQLRLPVRIETVLGIGMVLATGTALFPMLLGNAALEHHTWSYDLPVLGTVKWTSALFFDTGVFLVVVGVVGTLVEIFVLEGDDPEILGDEGEAEP